MARKGWFAIKGVQDGDRTLAEQMLGLSPALAACSGKTVLDLGSAEGLISREFAKAGAQSVLGIELLEDHVKVARRMCADFKQVRFVCQSLLPYIEQHPEPEQFDIVLMLSIAHKLHDPGSLVRFAARSARSMLVFRGPGKKDMYWDGWLNSKFGNGRCHVPTVMKGAGFTEGETLPSGRGERVQYWHRGA